MPLLGVPGVGGGRLAAEAWTDPRGWSGALAGQGARVGRRVERGAPGRSGRTGGVVGSVPKVRGEGAMGGSTE